MHIYVSKEATDRFSWKKILFCFLGSIVLFCLVNALVDPIEMQRASDLMRRPGLIRWGDVPGILAGATALLPFVFPILAMSKAFNDKAAKEAAEAQMYKEHKRRLKEQKEVSRRAA